MGGWAGWPQGLRVDGATWRRGAAAGAGAAVSAARDAGPGLLVVTAVAAAALALGALWPALGATTMAVVLGALWANSGLHTARLRPGTAFAARLLLRIAVVLLGLQLSVSDLAGLGGPGLAVVVVTVAVTFVGTRLLGSWLGVSRQRSLLVATGFAVCGASAIGAMRSLTRDDEEDAAVAIALVTLCGTVAIAVLPAVRSVVGLQDPAVFGAWVGASVHDVGQTVATASRVPGALSAAVVVKLSRVVLLGPLVALVAVAERRRRPAAGGERRTAVVQPFVVAFVVAVAARSAGVVPEPVLDVAAEVQHLLLVGALVGLGTGIHRRVLGRTVGRDLLLGLASWALVAGVALLGVRLVHG